MMIATVRCTVCSIQTSSDCYMGWPAHDFVYISGIECSQNNNPVYMLLIKQQLFEKFVAGKQNKSILAITIFLQVTISYMK